MGNLKEGVYRTAFAWFACKYSCLLPAILSLALRPIRTLVLERSLEASWCLLEVVVEAEKREVVEQKEVAEQSFPWLEAEQNWL